METNEDVLPTNNETLHAVRNSAPDENTRILYLQHEVIETRELYSELYLKMLKERFKKYKSSILSLGTTKNSRCIADELKIPNKTLHQLTDYNLTTFNTPIDTVNSENYIKEQADILLKCFEMYRK